jgi:hypothetical protein
MPYRRDHGNPADGGGSRRLLDSLRRYERFWSASLDRRAAYAESKEAEIREKGR